MARFSHLYDMAWLLKSCPPEERTPARLAGMCGVPEERVRAMFASFPAEDRKNAEKTFSETPTKAGQRKNKTETGTPFWAAMKEARAGRYMEAAETLLEWLATVNDDGDARLVEAGLRFVLGCLAGVSLERSKPRQLSEYIGLCIQAQPLAFFYAVEPRLMRFTLLKGRKAAKWLMDSHNIGLMNILVDFQSICFPGQLRYGSLFRTTEQGTGFAGLSGDYRPENVLFFGAYHLAIGHPRLALDHFLLLPREKAESENFADALYRPWEAAAMGLTGDFEPATSLLLRYLRRQRPGRNTAAVCLLQLHLVHVLLELRDTDGALEHLDSLSAGVSLKGSIRCRVAAQAALARYHAVCGRPETAWRILRATLARAEAAAYRYAPPLPFFLELLHDLHVGGYPDISGYEYESMLEQSLTGPNLTLRHVALRLRATSLMQEGRLNGAIATLKKCRTFFVAHGLAWESAKTIALLALAYLRKHDRRTALRFAIEAWPTFNAYERLRDVWPPELVPLLPNKSAPPPKARTVPLQRQLIRLLLELNTASDNFLQKLLDAFCGVLGASSAEFWKCAPEGPVELLANTGAYSGKLTEEERLRLVKTAEENTPFVFSLPDNTGAERSRGMELLLPVWYNDEECYCLCLRGKNWRWSSDELTEDLLAQLKEMVEIPVRRRLADASGPKGNVLPLPMRDELICVSETMRDFLEKADKIASVNASVLLFGETGAGKELAARRIHRMSGRRGPFIAVNLSSIPEELFESEMLGYEKGAFTGANNRKKGILELVDGGTLFLDELPDISPRFQVKLLRVLQERNFMRLGGTRTIHSDFRLIAATNRNLKEEVRKGYFRADLYYRICVVMLSLPPLRERKDDIAPIARHYLRAFADSYHRAVPELSAEDCEKLRAYSWPGNIRELRNVMAQAAALSDRDHVYLALENADEVPEPAREERADLRSPPKIPREADASEEEMTESILAKLMRIPSLEEMENRYIQEVLRLTDGRISGPKGASTLLGINRTTLYKKMKEIKTDEKK